MLASSELSELRDGARELVLASQLSRMFGEVHGRLFHILNNIRLPLPDADVGKIRTRIEEVYPCVGADPLLAELLNCGISQDVARGWSHCLFRHYFVIDGIAFEGNALNIEYLILDLWNDMNKFGEAPLFLDSLGFAYIVYKLSKDGRFMRALDELERRGGEVKRAVDRVRAAVDFVDSIMHAVSVDASDGDDEGENVGINDEDAQRVFSILRDAVENGKAIVELPVNIKYSPEIVQCTDMRSFTPTYRDVVKKVYHWVDSIKFVKKTKIENGGNMYIDFVNMYGVSVYAHIKLDVLVTGTALFLIDLDKSYGTLRFINDVLMARIKRARKALKVAEEIAAVARLLTM